MRRRYRQPLKRVIRPPDPATRQRKCPSLFSKNLRVCHNARIERFTPATDSCGRGNFLKNRGHTLKFFYWSIMTRLRLLQLLDGVCVLSLQPATSSPFSVAELDSVIFTITKSPIRCEPRSNTTTRFCSVRPNNWSRLRLLTPSTSTS